MLHVTDDHGVAVLRIEHGKANTLDLELLHGLSNALAALARQDARALVLTGTGAIFSAGVDLVRVLDGGPTYVREFLPAMSDAFRNLFAFRRPVVAAVNGHAIAGGCVLAMACDYRLMAHGPGTIGVPELRVGVPFPLAAIEILRFATSTAHLQELVYRGKTYPVDAAFERGLIDETVPAEALLERAREVAEGLAAEPAGRFLLTKRQLRAPTLATIERDARETDPVVLAEWIRPATLAAIGSYLEALKGERRP